MVKGIKHIHVMLFFLFFFPTKASKCVYVLMFLPYIIYMTSSNVIFHPNKWKVNEKLHLIL